MKCKIETTVKITIDGTLFASVQAALDHVTRRHRLRTAEVNELMGKVETAEDELQIAEHELHTIEDTIGKISEATNCDPREPQNLHLKCM